MLQDLLLIGGPLLAITSLVLGVRSLFLPRLKIFGFRSEMGIFSGMIGFAAGTFLLIAAWPLPGHYPSKANMNISRAKECIDTAYDKYSCKFMSSLNISYDRKNEELLKASFFCVGLMKAENKLEKLGSILYEDNEFKIHNYCDYDFFCEKKSDDFLYSLQQREGGLTQSKNGINYDLRCLESGEAIISIDGVVQP